MIFLIGRHGSGKSTFGKALRSEGYKHISVGALRRLAKNGVIPSDVPYTLLRMLKRSSPGEPMSSEICAALLSFASNHKKCVIDGFPASIDHVEMCPPDAVMGFLWTPAHQRVERLNARAEATVRQWTPGRASVREDHLASVVRHARRVRRVIFIANDAAPDMVPVLAQDFLKKIARLA